MPIDYISAGASLLSAGKSLFGGGSKAPLREAKRQAAAAQERFAAEKQQNIENFQPFINSGTRNNDYLNYLLGTSSAYKNDVSRPTFEQVKRDNATEIFNAAGARKGHYTVYDREKSNTYAAALYKRKLAEWEQGNNSSPGAQNGDPEFGSLLKPFDQNDLDNDLVYNNGLQFGLDEGRSALEARMRANGSMGSGRALKDLTRFGNDYATTKTNDAYVRNAANKDRTVNYLNSQIGNGLTAASSLAGNSTAGAQANIGINSANSVAALSQNRQDNQQKSLDGLLTNLLYSYKNENSRQYKTDGGRSPPAGSTPPIFPNYYRQD